MVNKHWGVFQVHLQPPRRITLYDSKLNYIDSTGGFQQRAADAILDLLFWAYEAAGIGHSAQDFRNTFEINLEGLCQQQAEAECGALTALNCFRLSVGRPLFPMPTGPEARIAIATDIDAGAIRRPTWQ